MNARRSPQGVFRAHPLARGRALETSLIVVALFVVFRTLQSAAYFARFHTSSAFPPPEAAVLVYFISSPVIVTDRF